MRRKYFSPPVLLMLFITLSTFFSCNRDSQVKERAMVDSLNNYSYRMHYKNLNLSLKAASDAYKLSTNYPSGRAEALNNLGFVNFMRMDFEKSEQFLKQVYNESNNEIENLIADINLMKIYQRTALNKDFYDYRNSALRRFKRIDDDIKTITSQHDIDRLNYARSEFYITSSIYYYYLQQDELSVESINEIKVDYTLASDTAQYLYYYYMIGSGGLYQASSYDDIVIGEFNYLIDCLKLSKDNGYIYFEANSSQAIAELLKDKKNYNIIMRRDPGLIRMINRDSLSWQDLTLQFANQALKMFKKYGDWYQISGTYRTLASYYNELGEYDKGLENLSVALDYVNMHHQKYYGLKDSTDHLSTFIPMDTITTELEWINKQGIKTVPEWIARLREQLSVTYAAIGMKPESDYNRNIYLDILDYTRQDKELESRYKLLEYESELLTGMLIIVVLGIIFIIILLYLISRRWKKKNAIYIDKLKKTIDVCRKITASVPSDISDYEGILSCINSSVGDEIKEIIGCDYFRLLIKDEEKDVPVSDISLSYPIIDSDSNEAIGEVYIASKKKINKEDKSLINIVLPYIFWTIDNGSTFISLGDERMRLEKEKYVYQQHIIENKRQNIVKKASLFVVTGITPFIDRIINESGKLLQPSVYDNSSVRREKLQYIDELITKINDYNDIIAAWIKMRQGTLSLNIENFELSSLFDVVEKGRRTFELRKQTLEVTQNDFVVKADKALTLFMINTLAENARKYTPANGKISLYATQTEDYVEISVEDNGPGISKEDVSQILDEKIYDSSNIGMSTSADKEGLKQNKGSGFGLMNCKGIIEKYKKTNEIFRVCKFDIDSTLGKGSRFYFRLPKGILKKFTMILLLVSFCYGCGVKRPDKISNRKVIEAKSEKYDSLLYIANQYAYKVYNSNVNRYYSDAVLYADSALYYLNEHYSRYGSPKGPFMRITGQGVPSELKWLEKGFDTDYYAVLDLRNEIAVAFLAIGEIDNYNYNNNAYTSLYRQISKDSSLEQYCNRMQISSNNKIIAMILCVVLLFILIIGYYVLYSRHMLMYRYNLEQILEINKKLFTSSFLRMRNPDEVTTKITDDIFDEMNELIPISLLGLAVYNDEEKKLVFSQNVQSSDDMELLSMMKKSFDEEVKMEDEGYKCMPLLIEVLDKKLCVGVLAIKGSLSVSKEDENLMLEIVAGYVAIVVYNAVVIVEKKHRDIENAQDDFRRAKHEENLLHVQNMVLDNCLSTIKHETIYYPNKIKQIVLKSSSEDDNEGQLEQIKTINELIVYYKDVFTILTGCALRQLADVTFKRSEIESSMLENHALKYFKYVTKKLSCNIDLSVDSQDISILGDEIQLKFMLENLISNALYLKRDGKLKLSIYREGDFARFDFTDDREEKSQDELNQLFYPDSLGLRIDESGIMAGTELLICKQIIRDHDQYTGRRGCRINASVAENGGYTIWFTVPLKGNR